MLVAKPMKLHVKWLEDGPIELREFRAIKLISCSRLETFGAARSQRLELVMIPLDTLTLDLLLLALNYSTTTIYQISKGN